MKSLQFKRTLLAQQIYSSKDIAQIKCVISYFWLCAIASPSLGGVWGGF